MSVSAPVGDTMPGAGRGSGGGLTHIAEALRPLAVPVVDLVLDPANARKHPERNLDAIAASLRRFGQRKPVVVQKAGMIVRAGNGTVTAARSLGWSHVAAVVVDEASVDATAFAIADNRTAELAEWDEPVLAGLLDSLPDEALPDTGFTEEDLRKLIASVEDRQITEDEAPEPLPDPVSKTGDLWVLGEHRLLCGDSTKAGDVETVMGGEKASVFNTDPPYGVSVAGGTHDPRDTKNYRSGGVIQNDGLTKESLRDFLKSAFSEAVKHLRGGAAWYVWYAGTETRAFLDAVESLGGMRHILVWVKPNFVFGRCDYHYRHEPVMYGWTDGGAHLWLGDRTQDSVWEAKVGEDDIGKKLHPTAKPVEIMARPIRNHTNVGDVVMDLFSGSGTTIIAAEQLGRKCYAIEIEPRYVDVGVRRWQKLTGKAATLNGKTFAEVAAERGVTLPNE